jgi:hypothetical protein
VSGFEVDVVKRYLSLVLLAFVVAVGSVVTSLVLPKDALFSPSSAIAQQADIRNGFVSLTLPSTGNQDDSWSCGANSAARVLSYYGHGVNYNTARDVAQFEHGIIPTRLCVGSGILRTCVNTGGLKTGLEPNEVRSVLSNWEGGNAKYESGADLNKIKRLLSQGKPVIVLRRVGSIKPGGVFGTWPAMHWVAVHGYNDQKRKIYFTETKEQCDGGGACEFQTGEKCNGVNCELPYDRFMSEWDWRIGDGLASETFHRKGVKPRTIVWVDRTPPSLASSPAQPRVGYFDNGATVFFSNGSSYCGFASPNHLQFFRKVNSAPSLGRRDPGSFGTYTGACFLPSGYFDNGATVFLSQGNGTFCGFADPQSYDSHGRSRPQLPRFGRLDADPNSFMSYTGVCQ